MTSFGPAPVDPADGTPEVAAVFALPMRTRFRGITVREGALLHGPAGWGEFAPFVEYDAPEAARWWDAAVLSATRPWPPAVRDAIPVNVTVPAVDPARARAIVAAGHGCRTAKVKVAEPGGRLAEDVDRVQAVADELGPGGRVRIDVNGRWSVDEAIRAIRAMSDVDLEYVEQPCATLSELAALRRRIDVPIAADESVRKAADPMRIAGLDAADIVVLKVAPLGGVHAALEVAGACGLPVVVSSALDTSVGIAAGLALAAALPELPYACGLGTVALFDSDVVAEPLVPIDGVIPVRRPEPDPALVQQNAAPPERVAWWYRRIADVRALRTDR